MTRFYAQVVVIDANGERAVRMSPIIETDAQAEEWAAYAVDSADGRAELRKWGVRNPVRAILTDSRTHRIIREYP